MILRGRTPRALTRTGLFAVVALGLVLLPLVPTCAQDLPAAAPPAQKDDKVERGGDKADPDKARQELQKLQDDYIKLQRQMEDKRRELEQNLQKEFGDKQQELMKRMQEAARNAGFGGLPPLGLPGGPLGRAPGGPPGFALPPGDVPGFPRGGPGLIAPGMARPDFERRLDELERKLDKLIERLGGDKAPQRKPADPNAAPPRGGAPGGAPPAGAAPDLIPSGLLPPPLPPAKQ